MIRAGRETWVALDVPDNAEEPWPERLGIIESSEGPKGLEKGFLDHIVDGAPRNAEGASDRMALRLVSQNQPLEGLGLAAEASFHQSRVGCRK